MFKNIIAPIQAWLMVQGKCVGCGMVLAKGEKVDRKDGTEKIICKCGRIYIYDKKTKKYRRALVKEV